MRTKQDQARKEKWSRHQPGNLNHCKNPNKFQDLDAEKVVNRPSQGNIFMAYWASMISKRIGKVRDEN